MGAGQSREQAQDIIDTLDAVLKREWEKSKVSLASIDQRTRVPHLLIEVRSLGFVEIQGKDTGGIYQKLDQWLRQNWRVEKLEMHVQMLVNSEETCGCCGFDTHYGLAQLEDHHRLCDASYTLGKLAVDGRTISNGIYQARDYEGENNMGKLTMQIVNFMTHTCGWTFQLCDSGNLGRNGDIREQQIKFKAPHPLNLIAPLIMIELRQVGYIEVNGPDTNGIYSKIGDFAKSQWGSSQVQADPLYCDLKFQTRAFQSRGFEGENNMGLRTMELVDFMVKQCQWTLVTCNGGNYGRKGDKREQQLVFRNDEFVQHGADHIMVELRTVGYIEINGMHDADDLKPHLIDFLVSQWGCKEYTSYFWEKGGAKFCDLKYTVPQGFYYRDGLTNNLGRLTISLADFLSAHGWALLLANGGSVQRNPDKQPNDIIREQQLKFTRARTQERAKAPLLMVELRTIPVSDTPPQSLCLIEICGLNTNGVYDQLHKFITEEMDGRCTQTNPRHCDRVYECNKFRLKPSKTCEWEWDGFLNGESNIGKWTMRFCDFMVDHLGEWDLIACNSDNLSRSFSHGSGDNRNWKSVTAREMQMIFRHKPGGRAVFMSADANVAPLGRPPLQPPPYWTDPGCISGTVGHKLIPGTAEELSWMQELLDKTFKQKVTRDRRDGQPLADRFAAVQCLRSEHPELWDRFAKRRKTLASTCKNDPGAMQNFVVPKTMAASEGLASRCIHATFGNPANQAYLLHGTNPTAAVAILSSSFKVDLAGKTAGTMFGPGVYLAESSTKADEYARDDVGGEYDGLYAVLVCKVVLGRSFLTEKAGDFTEQVTSGRFDHVLGDREKAVGTFREFVLFHEASIYPEYAVFYRREKDGSVMAPPPRESAPAVVQMETAEEEQAEGS
mmetsp:Transcript_40343/g.94826  ORF Transcript_40343/g.94826 Transcript_40343/m.94826 type:complete len:894 (+) Transcript_40343:102-2783(+)